MRAPGAATGVFAIETAMDELAYGTGLDPIELRLRNYTEKGTRTGPIAARSCAHAIGRVPSVSAGRVAIPCPVRCVRAES